MDYPKATSFPDLLAEGDGKLESPKTAKGDENVIRIGRLEFKQ